MTPFAAVVIFMLASSAYGYPSFQEKIPNGDKVPNPCNPSTIWMGVGHQNLMGGGPRNPFGMDFEANNKTWDTVLCQKDSDGDGLSNGQELGDPNCTWSKGKPPTRTTNLTHPGVCEPLGSTICAYKNTWLTNCNNTKFDCPAINNPGVRNYTLRFPPTPVPTDDTTYICTLFTLPNDSESDIIAIEPVLDNMEIIHHMLLFGCTDDVPGNAHNEPYPCGMGGGLECSSLIGIWGFGAVGQCLYPQLGFRIGPTGYQHAVLQIHWNNPNNKPGLTDSSGMRLWITKSLRPNRGEIMMVGQNALVIPPRQDNVSFSGSCTALCTKAAMNQSVYITSSALHMHLLGKNGMISLYRNGQLLKVIDKVASYDYNTPTMIEFATPIEMKPGDSIKVDCTFDASLKNTTTFWGEETSDEMCYGFFAYYPQIRDFTFCGQIKSVGVCGKKAVVSDRCDLPTFLTNTNYLPTLCSANCSNSSCTKALNAALNTGCQRDDDVREFIYQRRGSIFLDVLAKCALVQPPASTVCTTPANNQAYSHCSLIKSYSGSILLVAFVVYIRQF